MCGSEGRRGGNSCAVDVAGDDSLEPPSAPNSERRWPDDGGVGSEGRSMLMALSIERFTLTFFSKTRLSRFSSRDAGSGSGEGNSNASRSRRSFSRPLDHFLSTSPQLVHPFCRARASAVTPCLSGRSGCAPSPSSIRTMCSCPFAAAKCSGVAPDAPTIAVDASLFLSLKYLRGSLVHRSKHMAAALLIIGPLQPSAEQHTSAHSRPRRAR